MSQAINQAVQCGSLCVLLGGLVALRPQEQEAAVRPRAVMGQGGGGVPIREVDAQRCALLLPKARHPIFSLAHAVRSAIRGWRQ